MIKAKALSIAKDIYRDDTDPEDKLTALQEVIDMETHNSITKAELINTLRWLLEDYL